MALTGDRTGPPCSPGWSIAAMMHRSAAELALLGGPSVDGPALLGERAAFSGATRRGRVSCGGSCHLLRAADGWLAVNLARHDDVALANAWLDDVGLDAADPWPRLAASVASARADDLVARAAPLGLAVSRLGEAGSGRRLMSSPEPRARQQSTAWERPPLVIDLSALWAGPLCAQLLGEAGARVVKVESLERPDGARRGAPAFFDLLHYGHEAVALPFRSVSGRAELVALLDAADIVIESSRPRALEQLGIDAEARVDRGAIWVSITAYGRAACARDRVGYGDDVAIAAGLFAGSPEAPRFCGDAIADPITGLRAAIETMRAFEQGRGRMIDMALVETARRASGELRGDELEATRGARNWRLGDADVASPRARVPLGRAARLGSHTEPVLREFGIR